MGLFSFGKKQKTEGFEFIIDETFALNTGTSAVATGRLKKGRITPGTMAVCLDGDGNPVFSCPIEGIEQGTHLLKAASADARGTYGAHYGLKLGGVIRNQIPIDGTLVEETEERLEALRQRRADAGVRRTAAEADPAEGPVGEAREQELLPLLEKAELQDSDLEELKIQECIFLLVELQAKNSREAVESYQAKGDVLYKMIIRKLREASRLYVTLDENTGLPFITGDTVDVYSSKKLAKQAAVFYGQQNRHLLVREASLEDSELPGHINLFAWLYYLGMEKILVDNGGYKLLVKRADILPPPDETQKSRMEVPVTNPPLRFAMADFLGEIRWRVSYAERQENIRVREERLMEELKGARLLVPVKSSSLQQGSGVITMDKDTSLNFPKVEDNDGKSFLPLFTDWLDFQKAYHKEEWGAMVVSIYDGITIAGDDGIVVNPLGENLVLNQAGIEKIKSVK